MYDPYEEELKKSITDVIHLILSFNEDKLSIEEFIEIFNNFYYFEALDGHEANTNQKIILQKWSDVISILAQIQTEIIDRVYVKDDEMHDLYIKTGRIDREQAVQKLKKILQEKNINELLEKLVTI